MTAKPIIKICGIKSTNDVDACIRCGASAVGLNFYPSSPRYVSFDQATTLRTRLGSGIQAVGVFVRPTLQELQSTIERVGLAVVQIHGADEAYLQILEPLSVPVWLAQGIASSNDLEQLQNLARLCQSKKIMVGALLVDAKSEDQQGGSGKQLPWNLLQGLNWELPLILSGGLSPENVDEAIHQVKPDGVDVASGVESAPGVKDPVKIKAFVVAARNAFQKEDKR